ENALRRESSVIDLPPWLVGGDRNLSSVVGKRAEIARPPDLMMTRSPICDPRPPGSGWINPRRRYRLAAEPNRGQLPGNGGQKYCRLVDAKGEPAVRIADLIGKFLGPSRQSGNCSYINRRYSHSIKACSRLRVLMPGRAKPNARGSGLLPHGGNSCACIRRQVRPTSSPTIGGIKL